MRYLGLPIGVSSKKESFWQPLINKVKQKLTNWKAESLNQAGRLTLVKSVMDSIPLYWMNLHYMPSVVLKKMEKLRGDFLWGQTGTKFSQERKLHLVSWDKICRPKSRGG